MKYYKRTMSGLNQKSNIGLSILLLCLMACASTPDLSPNQSEVQGRQVVSSARSSVSNYSITDPREINESAPPTLIELSFDSHGKRLNGHLYLANGIGPHPTVILLHGFPGNEKNLDLAQALRRDGYNVLFFHYRGAWGSEGIYSFNNVIEDVASAANYLRDNASENRIDADRLILIGHSLGGFAALQGAANDEDIQCVAGISAADLGVSARRLRNNDEAQKGYSAYANSLQMLNGLTGKKAINELLTNTDRFDVAGLAPKLKGKSVLLIAAQKDSAVSPELVHKPMVLAYEKENTIMLTHKILPGDHSYSWTRGLLIDEVLQWIQSCS